ncbi:microspherule protein 1 [Chironomus tepperi]|uniref:microspherule protein 1 n=1 Tax=Chironomus tepperi TaxID=113505 RepID=UPI00391F27AA
MDSSINASFEAGSDGKRRSSNRSIKRKRFDDEIVEYSLGGLPQGRIRTQSQTLQASSVDTNSPTTTITVPSNLQQIPETPISAPPILVPTTPNIFNTQNQPMLPERKRGSLKANIKKTKRRLGGTSTKDLGRFKPTDDLALVINIQHTNDIKTVHRGTKFSCKFTIQELSNRWYSLMYDESISRIAISAMRNLHPEMISSIQQKALFSKVEEDILTNIKSTESPTEETFQELLTKNATVFYHARTPKSLMTHWELLRQYMLLNDQVIPSSNSADGMQSFSDFEETLNDNEILTENKDENLELELALADRKNKKEIRTLENELQRWSVMLDSVTGIGISPEFDNQTLAILRGRAVRYLMRSREITVGRNSKDFVVDVNLSLEGPSHKVSRKQGTIKMRNNGDFFLVNEGKRPIFVDGVPIITGNKIKLHNNNVIEISGLRFIFLINQDLVQAIRLESAKLSTPLN